MVPLRTNEKCANITCTVYIHLPLLQQIMFVVGLTAVIGLCIAVYFYWVNWTKGAMLWTFLCS